MGEVTIPLNYEDKDYEQLEQEERKITEETIATILLLLSDIHNDIEKELRSFYQRYGKDGVVTYQEAQKWISSKDHRKRSIVLYLFINDAFNNALPEIENEVESLLKGVIQKESDFFNVDFEDKDITKILTSDWGIDELNWNDRLADDVDLWTARLANDRKINFLNRTSIEDVLQELDKRFDSMERLIRTLVMSESTAIGSLARKMIFKELGVKKYRYYAREDERTCEHCGALHGLVFPISAYEVGVTASPIHPNCRCWEVPIYE